MAGRKKPPAPVLVVDTIYGLVGSRRAGQRRTMPGGVVVVAAGAGIERLPDDLTPSEIHVSANSACQSPFQAELRDEMVEDLISRMS